MSGEVTRILDIGIGRGGSYIQQDNGILRIGLDRRPKNLQGVRKNYGIPVCIADVIENNHLLPFASHSFHGIELYFPHEALFLDLLIPNTPIWFEFKRLMEPNGYTQVIFDAPNNRRVIDGITVSNPQISMQQAAKHAGLDVLITTLSEQEMINIGTMFANKVVRDIRKQRYKTQEAYCLFAINPAPFSGNNL